MPVSPDEFRRALSRFASGVTVVTAIGDDGKPHGITVSAFSSLSLEPPLVIICIDRRASLHAHLHTNGHFAVNVLSDAQQHVSEMFASREPDRFDLVPNRPGKTGPPLLDGALAWIECRIVNLFPGGDHTIVVGEVEASGVGEGRPLVYYRGDYHRLA